MPSKGGRDRTAYNRTQTVPVVSGPPLVRSREEWASAGFAEAELARPLHRGVDTERFNELAARQDQLTPEESDELYGYRLRRLMSRLRRLDRVRGSENEDQIRAALEDLDHRIEELRRFEAERSAAGLSTGYEVDLSSRTAAVDRLLELAHHRVPGLIAGSAVAPPQPTGNLRVSVTPFAPAPGDVPVYVLAPASIPSDALARNVEAVAGQGAQLHLVHDPADIPRGAETAPLVINWGGSEAMPSDLVIINRPEAVRISSDQVESIRRLGDLAPRTVARPDRKPESVRALAERLSERSWQSLPCRTTPAGEEIRGRFAFVRVVATHPVRDDHQPPLRPPQPPPPPPPWPPRVNDRRMTRRRPPR